MPKISDGGRTYTLPLRKGLQLLRRHAGQRLRLPAAIERVFAQLPRLALLHRHRRRRSSSRRPSSGGIPGIETDDATGEITIHLVKPRGTFTNELALPFAAPLPAETPAEDLTADPPPATGPYEIVASKPGRGWDYGRNPRLGEEQREADAAAPQRPRRPDRHRRPPQPLDPGQRRRTAAATTGWSNPPPADRYAEVKSKYEGTQFQVEPTISTYFFWMNTTSRRSTTCRCGRRSTTRSTRGRWNGSTPARSTGTQQILPPGMPGYEQLRPLPARPRQGEGTDRRGGPERSRNHRLDRQRKPEQRSGRILRRGAEESASKRR